MGDTRIRFEAPDPGADDRVLRGPQVMTLWYLAAPVSGEIHANYLRARDVLRALLGANIPVIAPWLAELDVLRVYTAEQEQATRAAALVRCELTASRCDGVICVGPPTEGMQREVDACLDGGPARQVVQWDGEHMYELIRHLRGLEGT